jgi:hypothetical protein
MEKTTVTFNATVTGTATLYYQWFKDGNLLPNGGTVSGATTRSLQIANLTTNDAGSYSVTVTNGAGSATSRSATLTVLVPPTIITQPAGQSIIENSAVTFTVEVNGTAPLRYQWRKNGGNIAGATGPSFTSASVKTSDAANYSVVVANSLGSVTSANARLTVNLAPVFTSQAASRTATNGTTTVFSATVKGTAPFSYQWFKDGNPLVDGGNIFGSVSNVLTVANLTANDSGAYYLTVNDAVGSVTSSNAVLTVVTRKSSGDDDDEQEHHALVQFQSITSIVPVLPPVIANLARNVNGGVTLSCSGAAGSNYVLQASSNLTDWTSLSTNMVPASGEMQVDDPDAATLPCRFYRLTTP